MRKADIYILNIMLVLQLAGCGKTADREEPETAAESALQEEASGDEAEETAAEGDTADNMEGTAAEDDAADNVEETAAEDGAADQVGEDIVKENAAEKGTVEDTAEEESGEPSGAGNKYYIAGDQYVDDDETKYGTVKKEHEEFQDRNGIKSFYYDMDCFYFDETYPAVVNETLQTYYDGKKEAYRLDYSENYTMESYGEPHIPYDNLIFFYVTCAGDDYVSLVFNDVSYMGGAHPYSALEGITIDCSTGEMVTADRFTGDSAEETGAQIEAVLGEGFVYTPEHWSYYITEESVVFFYYDPRFWGRVATKRVG